MQFEPNTNVSQAQCADLQNVQTAFPGLIWRAYGNCLKSEIKGKSRYYYISFDLYRTPKEWMGTLGAETSDEPMVTAYGPTLEEAIALIKEEISLIIDDLKSLC